MDDGCLGMETNAFEQLAKEHLKALYSYCLAVTCDVHKAEELAQETLYRAYVSFHRLSNKNAFFSWLIAIAKRSSWSWFRQARRDPLMQRLNEDGANPLDSIEDSASNISERIAEKERIQKTLKALKKLSQSNREVIILRYFEELSYDEIARRLNVSVDAVDQRLTRSKQQLRRSLKPMEF